MADEALRIPLTDAERAELRLRAVREGRTVGGLIADLIRADQARHGAGTAGGGGGSLGPAVLARFGIDPDSPQHRAIAERARAHVQPAGSRSEPGAA